MRIFFNTCGIVVILLCLVFFATQNSQEVTINFYGGLADTFPLWAIILVPFFAGVVAGNLLDVIQRLRLKRELRRLRREFYQASSQPNP